MNCPNCESTNYGRFGDSFDLDMYCRDCSYYYNAARGQGAAPAKPVVAAQSERISLADVKRDIADAFNAAVGSAHSLGGEAVADVVDARDRVMTFLERAEADLVDSVALATDEALVAELRQRLTSMKPGSRLDVFDAIAADYCIQCGDPEVDGVCHCTNDE